MPDDIIYATLLLVSVGSGVLVRNTRSILARKLIASSVGIGLVLFSCGLEGVHPLIVTGVNCLLILLVGARWCHIASFIWCFGYLAFFRAAHWFGLPRPQPVTNALQLFNALRELHLKYTMLNTSRSETMFRRKQQSPYYKYRTYHDMLHLKVDAHIPIRKYALARIKQLPVIAVVYLGCSYFFNIQYVKTEEFSQDPLWFRLVYMVPMFQIFRTRLYLAWIMSELMCFTAGLGAYPVEAKAKCGEGPSDFVALKECSEKDVCHMEYEFETVHNLDIWGCELAPTTREGLRSWNMSVQYWLAAYVHRRLPRHLGAGRVAITMGVSAFWHGIHPGYYLSFLTVPPILVAEDLMIAAFRRGSATQMLLFDWACWFFKMRGFDYNCMGFLLLTYGDTVAYWKNIYFMAHIVIVIFCVIGYLLRPKKSKKKKE
ncbi:MBOA7-like protein [Mya arenaria]|uniref:Lysophospholipid acyltransferase 7 n=1 Tax=Mya arenaria TaxID=6604 RepID=A0ABY7DM58_MYAAR|nr:MBOA7-like protein [Mya arenaria]